MHPELMCSYWLAAQPQGGRASAQRVINAEVDRVPLSGRTFGKWSRRESARGCRVRVAYCSRYERPSRAARSHWSTAQSLSLRAGNLLRITRVRSGGNPYYRPHRPPRCASSRGASYRWRGSSGRQRRHQARRAHGWPRARCSIWSRSGPVVARPRGRTGTWGRSGQACFGSSRFAFGRAQAGPPPMVLPHAALAHVAWLRAATNMPLSRHPMARGGTPPQTTPRTR